MRHPDPRELERAAGGLRFRCLLDAWLLLLSSVGLHEGRGGATGDAGGDEDR
jgi:hypothetical protein